MGKVQDFVEAIVEERDGFNVGEPWRVDEGSLSAIVPITRKVDRKRDYITLAEAKDVKVEDTGNINSVYVKNNEDKPLLISRGEIFRGKSQERAAIHGHIVMPGKGMAVSVRCVHQTRGIVGGEEMKGEGRIPYSINLRSQPATWETVSNFSAESKSAVHSFMSSGIVAGLDDMVDVGDGLARARISASLNIPADDNLVGTLDNLSEVIKAAMKKIPYVDDQVGAIFIRSSDILGLDIYDIPASWEAVKEDIVEKEGASFLTRDKNANIFEFKPEAINEMLGTKLAVTFEEKVIYGEAQGEPYKIVELKEVKENGKRLMGEAVVFNDRVIHLTLYHN